MNIDFENPFDEEFDKEDVIKSFSDKELSEPLISKEDLKNLIDENSLKSSVTKLNENDEDEFTSSLIKEEDTKDHKIITAADLEAILNRDEAQRLSDNFNDEYSKIDPTLKDDQTQYILENFKDFIIAPKITGAKNNFKHANLLPADYITNRGNKIELIDDPLPINEHEKTSIEINRNKIGEIDSIIVHCKCGEKTMIQFDFLENDDDNTTTFIKSDVKVQPMFENNELDVNSLEAHTSKEEAQKIINEKFSKLLDENFDLDESHDTSTTDHDDFDDLIQLNDEN